MKLGAEWWGTKSHTEHWGKIGTLWREDWIYSKAFNCLKLNENSLYFCILMSLKICKLVIIKPFSLAQLPRRPQSLKNQTVMPTLRERNALHLHYWWYVLEELPSENKKKEHFMMCFMFYIPSCHGPFETVYACKISHLRHCLFWVYTVYTNVITSITSPCLIYFEHSCVSVNI